MQLKLWLFFGILAPVFCTERRWPVIKASPTGVYHDYRAFIKTKLPKSNGNDNYLSVNLYDYFAETKKYMDEYRNGLAVFGIEETLPTLAMDFAEMVLENYGDEEWQVIDAIMTRTYILQEKRQLQLPFSCKGYLDPDVSVPEIFEALKYLKQSLSVIGENKGVDILTKMLTRQPEIDRLPTVSTLKFVEPDRAIWDFFAMHCADTKGNLVASSYSPNFMIMEIDGSQARRMATNICVASQLFREQTKDLSKIRQLVRDNKQITSKEKELKLLKAQSHSCSKYYDLAIYAMKSLAAWSELYRRRAVELEMESDAIAQLQTTYSQVSEKLVLDVRNDLTTANGLSRILLEAQKLHDQLQKVLDDGACNNK